MAHFKLTKKAVADLNEIWKYTKAEWSETQADYYYKMIMEHCYFLAANPHAGREYQSIAPNLYGFKAKRHIIFYRLLENKPLEITRILHGRMDLKTRMK